MSNIYTIVGLDQSITNTGWGCCTLTEDDKIKWSHGCIKTRAKTEDVDRLTLIRFSIESLILTERPDVVLIEEVFPGRNNSSTHKLFMLLGSLITLVKENGIKYRLVSPQLKRKNSWRKPLNLTTDKKDAVNRLREEFIGVNEHSAEALCMVHTELISQGFRTLKDFNYFNHG